MSCLVSLACHMFIFQIAIVFPFPQRNYHERFIENKQSITLLFNLCLFYVYMHSARAVFLLTMALLKATIAGHSFVRRQLASSYNNNMDLSELNVNCFSISGGRVIDMCKEIKNIISDNLHVVFLQIGGNEFSSSLTEDYQSAPVDLANLASSIRRAGVPLVYIGKLYYRGQSRYLCNKESVSIYSSKVDWINQQLATMSPNFKSKNITLWNHKGQVQLQEHILHADGTHLNDLVNYKLWRSIRGALIQAKNILLRCTGIKNTDTTLNQCGLHIFIHLIVYQT